MTLRTGPLAGAVYRVQRPVCRLENTRGGSRVPPRPGRLAGRRPAAMAGQRLPRPVTCGLFEGRRARYLFGPSGPPGPAL